MQLHVARTWQLGSPAGQLRAAPVQLGPHGPHAILVAYAADFDVDPYVEMFFFPSDTLKLGGVGLDGSLLWRRDLGRAVVPGMWFCPLLPFDLDGDGVDEIYFVNNTDARHPLGISHYVLERIDARTGATTGQWPWPAHNRGQDLSAQFRNFLAGGYAQGEPVLVSAQGTYHDMYLQAWRPDMSWRWQHAIAADAPGARGSHQTPVLDLNHDGVDELLWGERCIELDTGRELFCADRALYRGHSDIIQPVCDRAAGRWLIFTAREGDDHAAPRIACFDDAGRRLWGALDHGHMDMGWVARWHPDGSHIAMAIRIGHKTCGPDGRSHDGIEQFAFVARTGEPFDPGFSLYRTIPVDLNGDGLHELVRAAPGGNGDVLDRSGRVCGSIGGTVAMAGKFMPLPGEQLLVYAPDGCVTVWADRAACDTHAARERYALPFYQRNLRLTCSGYNLGIIAGA